MMQALLFAGYPQPHDNQSRVAMRLISGESIAERDNQGRVYAATTEKLHIGMSGGPVVDLHGRCLGISQGVYQKQTGSNTASPSTEDEALQKLLHGKAGFIPAASFLDFLTNSL